MVCPLTAPVAASAAIDMMEPTRKKPLIVPRSRAPSLRCHTSAIGGPPIAVAVPSTPEAAPARTTLRRARHRDPAEAGQRHAGQDDERRA